MKSQVFYSAVIGFIGLLAAVQAGIVQRADHVEMTSCADPSTNVVDITSFSIKPNPLVIPGEVSVASSFDLKETIESPISVDIAMLLKSGDQEVKTQQLYAHHFTDICETVALFTGCSNNKDDGDGGDDGPNYCCPFEAGTYDFPETTKYLDLPYKITQPTQLHFIVNATQQEEVIFCIEGYFDLVPSKN